ncbi:hypothetical protein [Auraticoccus monumenti]|uniref:Uncharacterized protein n=1 Tax=Auraticoccus monumenti TaxID=675864 RepID=A0A1G6RYS7_9ACTN|nr:hypothetical protein [Auraticoccus monumenti]SDD09107.1 hypothetical protein SAMN04489747_0144 [Auraticoccus monumenti]
MSWTEQDRADFEQAMDESLAEAVSPPVPFDDATPHECAEAVRSVLGVDVGPGRLAGLTEQDLTALAAGFGTWFASSPPSVAQVRRGVESTLRRWPA